MNIAQCPKSKQIFKEYIKRILTGWQNFNKDNPEFIPEELSDMELERSMEAVLFGNPRILYDFFDENNIFMSVHHNGYNAVFSVNETDGGITYKTRREAEEAGFRRCFEEMEKK